MSESTTNLNRRPKVNAEPPRSDTADGGATDTISIQATRLGDDDERLRALGATPTSALSQLLRELRDDATDLNEWLELVLSEKDAGTIITAADESRSRMSQAIGALRRHGHLDEAFFDALASMYAGRSADILPARAATLERAAGWRATLTDLLVSLFTDPAYDRNKALDQFLAAHFLWEADIRRSIVSASRPDIAGYSFEVSRALIRHGHLDHAAFYQKAYRYLPDYWKPALLHIWWMQRQARTQ